MFADTDFILAMVKDSDWLKENALKILKENKGRIKTSVSVMIEIALMCEKYDLNVFDAFHAAYCGDDKIISSDDVYESVGIGRVKLER